MSRDPVRLRESVSEASPSLRELLRTANDDVPTPARLKAIAAAIEARAAAQPVSARSDIAALRPRSWRRPVMAVAGVAALAAGGMLWLQHAPRTTTRDLAVNEPWHWMPTVPALTARAQPAGAPSLGVATSVVTVRSPPPGVAIFVDGVKRGENLVEVTAPVGSHAEISCTDPKSVYVISSGAGAVTWTADDQLVSCTPVPHASNRPAPEHTVHVETDHELSPDEALMTISSLYMKDMQSCYQSYLKVDPTANGTLQLSFTVTERGQVDSPAAAGFPSVVSQCVVARMKSWKFRTSVDAHAKPIRAGFALGLSLVPGIESPPLRPLPKKKKANTAQLRKQFEIAQDFYVAKDFDAAAKQFKVTYDSDPGKSAAMLYNIASAYEMAGKQRQDDTALQQAIDYYQRYVAALPTADDVDKIKARIAKLKQRLTPSIVTP